MYKPIQDKVVIKEKDIVKNSGKIILLEKYNDNNVNKTGEVVAIGNLVECIKVGDNVLFTAFGPNMIQDGDDKLYIMREPDILAVIEE